MTATSRHFRAATIPTSTAGADDWRQRAACRDALHPDAWYAYGRERTASVDPYADARIVCRACPVAAECLTWALEHDPDHGLYGGVTPDERAEMRRRSTAVETPHNAATGDPGTAIAYKRGCRCLDCRDYNARTVQNWKARTS